MVEKQHVDYLKLEKTIFKKDNKIRDLQDYIDDNDWIRVDAVDDIRRQYKKDIQYYQEEACLLYTYPSPRDVEEYGIGCLE